MPEKEILNRIEYVSFRLLLAIFRLLPRKCARSILLTLFWLIGYKIGIRKKVAIKQLHKVYPAKSNAEIRQILKNLYRNMALSIEEIYLWDDDELFAKSQISGLEHVKDALALGRGALLATAHFGNWEAARILPRTGIPISVITKTQRNVYFDAYTNSIRERCGVKTIDMKRGLRDIIHHLNEGRFVAILIDQNAGTAGLLMDFLGFPASHGKGLAKLSLRYKVPIVPGFARRTEDNGLIFEFFPAILHKELDDKEENYLTVLSETNKIIEQQIHKWPDQWFWVHKRWKHGYDMLA